MAACGNQHDQLQLSGLGRGRKASPIWQCPICCCCCYRRVLCRLVLLSREPFQPVSGWEQACLLAAHPTVGLVLWLAVTGIQLNSALASPSLATYQQQHAAAGPTLAMAFSILTSWWFMLASVYKSAQFSTLSSSYLRCTPEPSQRNPDTLP
jgi:hypothetical protein